MIIYPDSDKIRYTGRWNIGEKFVTGRWPKNAAKSTANGNYFEFGFCGDYAIIGFDISYCRTPFPHMYINVDDGANIEVPLDRFIRISAKDGKHKVRVIMKGSVESHHRWFEPIESCVSLLDIEADAFWDLPEDNRPVIEFIGDSVTEGIEVDGHLKYYKSNDDMVYWDDATATYAWLTAEKLNLRPVIMAYGSLGTTQTGAGNIPPVGISYKYYSDGSPMDSINADFIVINHGANDRFADTEVFTQKYLEFLDIVRERNPKSKIIALTPFFGCLTKEIKTAVDKHNAEKGDDVIYIDSTGWIPPEPVHPSREGHKTVAEKFSEILKKLC